MTLAPLFDLKFLNAFAADGVGTSNRGTRRQRAGGLSKHMLRRPIRILGIDPGLRRTGWGVVEIDGNRLTFVACGSVSTDDKAALARRLLAHP